MEQEEWEEMRENTVKHSVRVLAMAALMLAVCMIAGGLSGSQSSMAYASVGSVNGTYYDNFDDLVDDVGSRSGETFTIAMTQDWKAGANKDFDQRLIIPKNSRVTFNMHGYVFDRSRVHYDGWTFNGELICVESGATLTINGGSEKRTHTHNIFTSLKREDYASTPATFEGGLLTGGDSTNGGGGLHIKADATVTLNNVTIAGCRAQQRSTTDGFGGGISIAGANTTLKLNDSTITGCYAYNDGGGIHVDNDNNVRIELAKSHVDKNYSGSDGGGIDVEGESIVIKGDENSTISNNMTGMYGGGVYLWNDEQTLTGTGEGLTIEGNHAREGGGIYTQEETISLSSLNILNNEVDFWSDGYGGGVYVNNDNTVILNCRITGNRANVGGGVYTNVDEDPVSEGFFVNGATVIKDNVGREGANNLTLVNGENRVRFGLTSGADVHMGYTRFPSWYSSKKYYQVTDGKAGDTIKASNCLRYLTPDNSAHHFTFNDAPSYRKIFYVADGSDDESIVGKRYTRASRENVSVKDAKPQDAGTVKDSAGNSYKLIRGFFRHEKTDSGTVDRDAIFYYTDGMFYEEPREYNDHLATASWVLAFAGSYLREGGGHADSYKYKHACGRQFLSDIGCPDENIYVNDSMTQKPGLDTIGVTIGSKNLQEYEAGTNKLKDKGDVLIPVSVRGGGYEAEWASNTTLGTTKGSEAQGFSEAADQVMSEIDYYIAKHGLEEKLANGQVKFWVTGFSRAGATANLVSKRLVEKYAAGTQDKPNQVFGYPCEPPKGGTDAAEELNDKTMYYCIHNLINDGDMVPLVAPGEMGFKRYGVDHYIPGTKAGSLEDADEYGVKTISGKSNSNNGSIDVTTYVDNAPLKTKTEEYNTKKTEMMANLKSIDSEIIFDDYFHPMAMDFFPGTSTYEAGAYDNTHVEDFLKDFFAILQDAPGDDDSQKEARTAVRSRQQYAGDPVEINGVTYSTIQQAGRDTMSLLFSLSEEDSASFAERAGSIMNSISTFSMNPFSSDITMVTIWKKVIGNWTDRTDAEKMTYINFLWDALAQTKALEALPPDDLARLEKNWPTLADMIFRFVEADYRFYPGSNGKAWAGGSSNSMMYTPTFMTFASYILNNHAPEVGIAWARIEDDYYGGEADLKEYAVEPGAYKPDAPSAKAGKTELSAGDKTVLVGDQKIVLDAEEIKGEAVYYTLKAGEKEIASEQVYRGAIDIAAEDGKTTDYTLTTYAMSYKKKSDPATYEFSVSSDRHEVTIHYGNGKQPQELTYNEGDQVVATAEDTETSYFTGWTIEDGEGNPVTEFLLTDEESKAAKVQFTMPKMGAKSETADKSKTYEWKAGYRLTVKAIYELKIDRVSVDLPAPEAGAELASEATVSWGGKTEQQVTVPVAWTYDEADGKTYAYSGIASNATVYIARLQIDQDKELGRIFTDKATAAIAGKTVETKKSAVDGSIEIVAAFDQTAEGSDFPRPTGPHTLTVATKDLNNETAAYMPTEEYQVFANTAERPMSPTVITAPDVEDMAFTKWEIKSDGIEVDESQLEKKTISLSITEAAAPELTIEAQYKAVLNEVAVTLDEPQAGEVLPTKYSEHFGFIVKISEQYEIDPENLSLEWTPAPKDGKAAYLTAYTATVQVVPGDDGTIGIRRAGSDASVPYIQRGIEFTPADAPDVTVNGEKAFYDVAQKTVTCSFNPIKYTLKAVKQPENISGVARGTKLSDVLPKTTTAVLADPEKEITVPIEWGEPKQQETTDPLGEATWTVSGTANMKDFENTVTVPDNVSLEVALAITVQAAGTVAAPRASLDSGTFVADQVTTLSSKTAGAHIYYTTDGSKATTSSKEYKGEAIEINRDDVIDVLDQDGQATGRKAVIIRAIAAKEDMRTSGEAVYQYEFSNVITIPKGESYVYNGSAQTGVPASRFYTLTAGEGDVTINDDGAATAVKVGNYTVIANVNDEYQWSLPYKKTEDTKVEEGKDYYAKEEDKYKRVIPDGSENPAEEGWFEKSESTTEPQTITFTIVKANLSQDAQIQSKASYNTVTELKKDVKVTIYGQELAPADYDLTVSPVVNGQVTVTAKAKGDNCEGTITKVINVAAIDQMGEDGTAFSKGASAGAANNALIKMKSNKDPKGTKFSPLKLKSTKQGKTSVKLTWKKAKGAIRYVVYGAQTGKAYKRLAAVSGKSYNVKKISKKLKKKTYHKFIIVALDKNGNVVTTSKVVHVATKGNLKKAANPKKVVVKAKVNKKGKKLKKYKKTSSIGLKKGKKTRLKASYTKAKKAKVKKKVGMRYESSNTKIATVTAKGVVKGKKKGICSIFVYAQNGVYKTVKVTVR